MGAVGVALAAVLLGGCAGEPAPPLLPEPPGTSASYRAEPWSGAYWSDQDRARRRVEVDVAELVRRLNALPERDDDAMCPANLGPTYFIEIDYPDGARQVSIQAFGCGDVRAGDQVRVGGEAVLSYLRGPG